MDEIAAFELEDKPSLLKISKKHYGSISTRQASSVERSRRVRLCLCGVCTVDQRFASIFFALLALIGNISQAIALPLWIDSAPRNVSRTAENRPTIDVFFVPHFCSVAMFVVYATVIAIMKMLDSSTIGDSEKNFPNTFLITIGVCGGTAGILACFSSSVTRTPPYLQAILSNFVIPMTIILRFIIIRKLPTRKKFVCAVVVMLCLFVSLIPTIFTDLNLPTDGGATSGTARVLWPICYMLQFVPTTFVAVMFEKIMKARDKQTENPVNLLYIYLWGSFYQMIFLTLLFWTDFIPGFGSVTSFKSFLEGYLFGLQCFVGMNGCTIESGLRACVLVLGMMLSVTGSAALVRHGEGATLLAIVMSLTSPLVFLFWSLFKDQPPNLEWDPSVSKTTWFSVISLCVMIPAILVYNTSTAHSKKVLKLSKDKGWEINSSNDTEPLIIS